MNNIKKKFGAITLATGLLTFSGSILSMDGPGWISAIWVSVASLALIVAGYRILGLPDDQEPEEDSIDWEVPDEDIPEDIQEDRASKIAANRDEIIRAWSHIVF